jgi:hypothetical protein
MNAVDVLRYGDQTLMGTLEGLGAGAWDAPGVCGWWSTRNIVAHLASYELVLAEVLASFLGETATPALDLFRDPAADFNDAQVAARSSLSAAATLDEYRELHRRVMALAPRIDAETYRRAGTLPWYGAEYALDDLIVYISYGHKREHSAQIAVFRDGLPI